MTANPHIDRLRGFIQTDGFVVERDDALAALDALAADLDAAIRERDDYRFWNERVRTCESHTKDVIDGDCLVCALAQAEARVAELEAALRNCVSYIESDCEGTGYVPAALTEGRAALAAAPADTEGSGRG